MNTLNYILAFCICVLTGILTVFTAFYFSVLRPAKRIADYIYKYAYPYWYYTDSLKAMTDDPVDFEMSVTKLYEWGGEKVYDFVQEYTKPILNALYKRKDIVCATASRNVQNEVTEFYIIKDVWTGMEFIHKECYFKDYCKTCKHKKKREDEMPCDECLDEPVNEYSHKPVKYEKRWCLIEALRLSNPNSKVFYICDQKQCNGCPKNNDACRHTTKLAHAKYYTEPPNDTQLRSEFDYEVWGDTETYWEREV